MKVNLARCIVPVFWAGSTAQANPDEDYVQADLSACDAQADALESV